MDGESLSHELQQLGLPKGICDLSSIVMLIFHLELTSSLCKAYEDNLASLQLSLQQHSLRVSRLQAVDWRVDHVISSSHLQVFRVTIRYSFK